MTTLASVFLVAMIAIAISPINFMWKFILVMANIVYTLVIFYSHGLLSGKFAIKKINLAGNKWQINDKRMTLVGDSTVTQFISVLRFKEITSSKIYHGVVWRDSLVNFSYQRLVMLLRTVNFNEFS